MMLTQQRLREVLSYDQESGAFVRIRALPGAQLGAAGGLDKRGYLAIRVDGQRYLAHRLAWLYVFGAWPEGDVDHANGDRADNRIENLRLANRSQNKANSKKYDNNSSGFKGVCWRKETGRWRARIGVNGEVLNLGSFDNAEDAYRAYSVAAEQHFGEFARVA